MMENMKRLAIFLATSGHSGVDRVVKNLIPEFARMGLAVDLLQIRAHGPYLESVPKGVRIVAFRAAHVNSAFPALCTYLVRERPEAILSDKDRVNRMVLWARKLTGLPSRVVVRIGTTVSENLSRRGWVHRRLQLLSIRWFYRWADKVILPSAGAARDLMAISGLPPDKLEVIPSPVVNHRMLAAAEEPTGQPWLDAADLPVVLGVGELSARKDFSTLIRAFALVRAQLDCRLVILGEGRKRRRLEQLVRDLGLTGQVQLPGFVNNPYACMKRARVLVLSSVCEGMPVVLPEALALGLPVVATDCPSGPREILDYGRVGGLVPMRDAEAMAEAIVTALRQPPTPALLRVEAEPYRIEKSARRYAAALGFEPVSEPCSPPGIVASGSRP